MPEPQDPQVRVSGPAAELDMSVPHAARVWNYWLGGKDCYAVDRRAGDEFLTAFPGLTRLSLADNMLTDISFVSSLPNLEYLDIKDNYVTDITPLEGLGRLSTLNCAGNPVGNLRVLSSDVTILQ